MAGRFGKGEICCPAGIRLLDKICMSGCNAAMVGILMELVRLL